jgi:hypothetical protein
MRKRLIYLPLLLLQCTLGCSSKLGNAPLALQHTQSPVIEDLALTQSTIAQSYLTIDQIERTLNAVGGAAPSNSPPKEGEEGASIPRMGATRAGWQTLGGVAAFSGRSAQIGFTLSHAVAMAQAIPGKNSGSQNSLCEEILSQMPALPDTDANIRSLSLLLLGQTLPPEQVQALRSLAQVGIEEQDFREERQVICAALVHHPQFLTY